MTYVCSLKVQRAYFGLCSAASVGDSPAVRDLDRRDKVTTVVFIVEAEGEWLRGSQIRKAELTGEWRGHICQWLEIMAGQRH